MSASMSRIVPALLVGVLVVQLLRHNRPLAAIAAGFAASAGLRVIYNLFFHPLARIPGPRLAAVSDIWKARAVFSCTYNIQLAAAHAKYGPVVRIGSNEVSITDPEEVKRIYGLRSEFYKGPFYRTWHIGPQHSHFSERDPKVHERRRRIVAPAYSINHLRSLEPLVDGSIELLTDRHLDRVAKSGKSVDLAELFAWFCYDSVAKMSFGNSYGLLESGKDENGLLADFDAGTMIVTVYACFERWGWIMTSAPVQRFLAWLQPDKGAAAFLNASGKIVSERLRLQREDPSAFEDKKDMLYRFLQCVDPSTGLPPDFDLLVNECIVIIVAGADTTFISMVSFIRHVYSNPAVLHKLRAELEEVKSQGQLTLPIPAYDEVARLPYLQACMKEAMRVHPAVAMTLPRVVPPGGRIISGRFYPEGVSVGHSAWQVHYATAAFGPDAATFRPERWLEADRLEMEKYNLSFGQGSRVCIGKMLSLMEMFKVLPVILLNYDIEIANPKKPYHVAEHWFARQTNFITTVSKRQ